MRRCLCPLTVCPSVLLCSPSGCPRPMPSSSTAPPRRRCWAGGPTATASSSRGACASRVQAAVLVGGLQGVPPALPAAPSHAAPTCCAERHGAPAAATRPACPPPPCRLPTTHPTLIKFSAPLFLDISFTSFGLSFGHSKTCSFVACMDKQVRDGEGGCEAQHSRVPSSWAQPRRAPHQPPSTPSTTRLRRSSSSSCWRRGGGACAAWTARCCAAARCRSGATFWP